MFDWAVFFLIAVAPLASSCAFLGCYWAYGRTTGALRGAWLAAGNLLGCLSLLALLFLAAECYYRFWFDSTDAFALSRAGREWSLRHYRYNQAGFRDNIEYTQTVVPGRSRVTFLGDSFTVGYGIGDANDRFANLLRSSLRREIHCFAANGWDTGHQLSVLRNAFARGYRTDQVVLVYVANDICDLLPEWKLAGQRVSARIEAQSRFLRASYAANMLHCRWIEATEDELRQYQPNLFRVHGGTLWNAQQARLSTLKTACLQHDATLSIVYFPFLTSLRDPRAQVVQEQLETFCIAQDIPFLDLTDAMSKRSVSDMTVNMFDPHPNERAHACAARAIKRFLSDSL